MKQGWEYKKIGEVCKIVSGSTPKTNISGYWGEGHYWITPAELNGNVYVDSTNRQITDAALAKTKLHLLPKGTVLLSSRAPIGKVAITTVPMYCNQGFKNCICSEVLFNKYLYYFLVSKNEYLNSLGVGATFKEISKSIVEKVSLPLPPLSEQHAIVAELDKINEIIDLKKAQLKDLDLLAQSIFYEMFGDPIENSKGWEKKKWEDVFKTTTGKLDSNAMEEDGIYPFFTCAKEVFRINTYAFDCEALLLAGNNAAGVYDVKHYKGKFNAYQRTYVITLSDTHNLYCIFKAQLEEKLLYLKSQSLGCNTKYLTLKILNSLDFIVPPLSLQQSFASKIQAIESQKSAIKQSLAEVETLLASRMDYWFN